MGAVKKDKNRFIVTLNDGRETYFDFSNGNIYGVSGKVVHNFSNEARKILKAEKDNNFLARYFYDRTQQCAFWCYLRDWTTSQIETVYSLFADRYTPNNLATILDFCYHTKYELNKNNIKTLIEVLHEYEDADGKINQYFAWQDIDRQIAKNVYRDFPPAVVDLILSVHDEPIQAILFADIKKIAFRYEHENWDGLNASYYTGLSSYLARYVQLCQFFDKERTYKNLFLSLCLMEKEKDLLGDSIREEYQKNAPLFFEDELFTVVIPTTANEFQHEADYQHNCVFTVYYRQVCNLKTHVVFIRKKNDINTPYITCEVNNSGHIVQYLTRFNSHNIDAAGIAFKNKYQEFLIKHF